MASSSVSAPDASRVADLPPGAPARERMGISSSAGRTPAGICHRPR